MPERLPSALVLAGGLGTRLPEVSAHRPKPMADVLGRPFLEYVLEHLARCGVSEVVLCIGYKAEIIEQYFAHRDCGLRVRCVVEPEPRGTAGALRLALPYIGERALALNGDSFAAVDVVGMLAFHREQRARLTLAAVTRPDAARFGMLRTEGPLLRAFEEKRPGGGAGQINAGVYLLERDVLASIAEDRAVSLERDVLPRLIADGERIAVYPHSGYFEDIGVPEGLAAFRAIAASLGSAGVGSSL